MATSPPTPNGLSITEGVESERFQASAVTWNLFGLLGEAPVLGRHFAEDEDQPLGASRRSVLGLVLGQGARLALTGLMVGAAGAFVVTRGVQTLLYNVTTTDPISPIGTSAVLAAITILAGCVPALRATSVDPVIALRAD